MEEHSWAFPPLQRDASSPPEPPHGHYQTLGSTIAISCFCSYLQVGCASSTSLGVSLLHPLVLCFSSCCVFFPWAFLVPDQFFFC